MLDALLFGFLFFVPTNDEDGYGIIYAVICIVVPYQETTSILKSTKDRAPSEMLSYTLCSKTEFDDAI